MKDLMIDIETLGTKPGSVILSIGAVAFDAQTGRFASYDFHWCISAPLSQAAGLTADVDTMLWWMKQSAEAQSDAFCGMSDPATALCELTEFVKAETPQRIWAKPPSFDIVLLEAAYQRLSLPIPWDYKIMRDCRTLFDITGTLQPTVGTVHNALDDAKAQAYGVIAAFAKLRAAGLAGELR